MCGAICDVQWVEVHELNGPNAERISQPPRLSIVMTAAHFGSGSALATRCRGCRQSVSCNSRAVAIKTNPPISAQLADDGSFAVQQSTAKIPAQEPSKSMPALVYAGYESPCLGTGKLENRQFADRGSRASSVVVVVYVLWQEDGRRTGNRVACASGWQDQRGKQY